MNAVFHRLTVWFARREIAVGIGLMAALGFALLVQTAWFRGGKSLTVDETVYLSAALQSVHDGRLDPRLARMGTAPLPILLAWLPVAISFGGAERSDVWSGNLEDPPIAACAAQRLAGGGASVGGPALRLVVESPRAAGGRARRRPRRVLAGHPRPHVHRHDRRLHRPAHAGRTGRRDVGLCATVFSIALRRRRSGRRRHSGQVLRAVAGAVGCRGFVAGWLRAIPRRARE